MGRFNGTFTDSHSLGKRSGNRRGGSSAAKMSLTAYEQDFAQKSLDGAGGDRAAAKSIADGNMGSRPVKVRGDFLSCYGALCNDRLGDLGHDLAAESIPLKRMLTAEENQSTLRTMMCPSVDVAKNPRVSHSGIQHGSPVKELIFARDPWLPSDHLGNIASSTDFFQSESHREFQHGRQGMRRTASAPSSRTGNRSTSSDKKEDLERAFRQAMMTSQYKFTHASTPSNAKGHSRRRGGAR